VAGGEAASATTSASNAAIAQQQSALQQQAALSTPYRALGEGAIPTLQSLITPGPSQTATLRQLPGYQFAQEQGTTATENAASAMGLALSGNTLQGLSKFNQGLADTTFQQQVGNLENVVGLGQAAAAGQAANIGNAASNISNTLIGQGQTLAGIDANVAAGLTKAAGNAANQYITQNTLAGLNQYGGPTGADIYGAGFPSAGGYDPVANPGLVYPG
jgi:hypothetical protein